MVSSKIIRIAFLAGLVSAFGSGASCGTEREQKAEASGNQEAEVSMDRDTTSIVLTVYSDYV